MLETALLLATVTISGLTRGAAAQRLCSLCGASHTGAMRVSQHADDSWLPVLASAVVPGSGQLMTGRLRGWGYLTAEVVLGVWHLRSAAIGRRERDGYRDLAFTVARGAFMPSVRDTAFEYFEHMADFVASGPYDSDPGPALTPPTDESTYNGSMWGLARRTFFEDPSNPPPTSSVAYQQALEFYRSRAVGPNFRWSWEQDPTAQESFRRRIMASDDAFRRSTILLGFVVANHLISAVDAHITRRLSTEGRSVESRTALRLNRGWPTELEVTWGLTVWF